MRHQCYCLRTGVLLLLATMLAVVVEAAPATNTSTSGQSLDWTNWRGPNYNGVSTETNLLEDLDPAGGEGSNLVWKNENVGGRSTPVVMDNRVYTLCRWQPATPREGERVVCVDATTGELLWENHFNVYLSDVPDTRVGWSAVVADPETSSVYALGVCGIFQCIDAKSGQTRWSIPLHEQFGLLSTYGGRTNFPIICDDLVIISAVCINWGEKAKPAHAFIGFDKRTGDVAWFSSTSVAPEDTTYSNPSLAVLNGQKSLVFGSGDGGIWSFQPRTGLPIWKYDLSRRGINTPPLVVGDMVYAGHSQENMTGTAMGAVVALDTSKLGKVKPAPNFAQAPALPAEAEKWKIDELADGVSQPMAVGDQIWVLDEAAKLWVLDGESGEPIGKKVALGRKMNGSMLYADGKLYAFETNGRWAIYRAGAKGVETVSKGRFPSDEELLGSPIVSHGRLYLQTTNALYCFADPSKQPGVNSVADTVDESPVSEDPAPAHVQVVPGEVLLRPGQTQQFSVRLFNSRGQRLADPQQVAFSVDGGKISADGKFTADTSASHTAVTVSAKVGDLTGSCRVRIVPNLPWKFDFSSGQIPVTWVGARYRHVALDEDLIKQLDAENPMAAQLYIYLASSFINSGIPKQVFDNSTPAQKWTQFQRFLNLGFTTVDEAKPAIDPALQVLVNRGVLASRNWEQVPNVGVRLTVQKGTYQQQGNGVMTKITTIPKGTRSRCWFGQSDLHDYTIVADVQGAVKGSKQPDIGVIAQGYILEMQGEHQSLEITTWPTQRRMAQSVEYPWKSGVWYTLKLRASTENGKAVLRGKVWERGEAEPDKWTVEATDESPNMSGSPGLAGNATNAEIFIDNIQVMAN